MFVVINHCCFHVLETAHTRRNRRKFAASLGLLMKTRRQVTFPKNRVPDVGAHCDFSGNAKDHLSLLADRDIKPLVIQLTTN